MSQAATLLAGLTEDTSAYSSSETHIVIGNDRFITVPESLKRLAVQYDHDVETVTFDCPRFWDEHDMSQMTPYINYLLPNGTTGQYKAENVSSDSSRMYFDWTISNNVTQYNGKLSFLVCIKKTDEDGNESNHWNSELNQDCYISAGLECAQTNITKYPDIITQLLTRMDEVEEIATPEAMQAYADTWLEENRESIVTEIGSEVRTKADAIICSTQGETISVSDSSDDYIRGLKIFGKTTQVTTTGKNLLDISNASPIEVNAEGALRSGFIFDLTGIYTFSCIAMTDTGIGYKIVTDGAYGDFTTIQGNNSRVHFTVTLADNQKLLVYKGLEGEEFALSVSEAQLEYGDTVTDYEPYSGGVASPSPEWPQELSNIGQGGSISVGIKGANLIPYPYYQDSLTTNGITFTVNDDHSVTANGTATATAFFVLCNLSTTLLQKNVRYYISDATALGESAYVRVRDVDASLHAFNRTFICEENDRYTVEIRVSSGVTLNNVMFYPMLNVGEQPMPYEPYKGQEALTITTTGGLPGIPVPFDGNYTDSNGQQWVCDEIDFERRVYIQRIKHINLADITGWTKGADDQQTENTNLFYGHVMDREHGLLNLLCNKLPVRNVLTAANDFIGICGYTNGLLFYVRIEGQYSLDDFRNWLLENEVMVSYQLATPIETPLTEEEIENFKQLHTNYPNTTIFNDSGAWMGLKYNVDAKTYIDGHGASDEQVETAITKYFTDNPLEDAHIPSTIARKTDIPKNLPNPSPLTLTGAVNAVYNGYTPITVEIPQGGGEKWETIIDYTVPEDCVSVVLKNDINGNPFSLKKAVLTVILHPLADLSQAGAPVFTTDSRYADYPYGCNTFKHFTLSTPTEEGKVSYLRVELVKTSTGVWNRGIYLGNNVGLTTQGVFTGGRASSVHEDINIETLQSYTQDIAALGIGSYMTAIGAGTRIVMTGVRE